MTPATSCRLDAGQAGAMAGPRVTVEKFLVDQWLPTIRSKVRETTWIAYETIVGRHLVTALGGKRLDRVQVTDINLLYAALLERLSSTTVRRIHGTQRVAFRDAVRYARSASTSGPIKTSISSGLTTQIGAAQESKVLHAEAQRWSGKNAASATFENRGGSMP
ncbi:MAG: hypothetical protein ACRD1T_26850 [Acidimicrobiia bacterium]